jgi:hypothetical protein
MEVSHWIIWIQDGDVASIYTAADISSFTRKNKIHFIFILDWLKEMSYSYLFKYIIIGDTGSYFVFNLFYNLIENIFF